MVCFIESLAESETPLEMTELSRGSIRFSILAITENPRSKPDLRVDTNSSETPPPSTPEMRHRIEAAEQAKRRRWARNEGSNGRARRWREIGGGGGCWRGLKDRSVMRERVKARAAAAMKQLD